jgi:excisionase family DNA binding protein
MSTELRYTCLKPEELEADLLTPDELAEVLGVTSRTVSAWMQRKKIPYHRFGWRCVRIRLSEVLDRSFVAAEKPFAPTPKPLKKKPPEQGKEAVSTA